MFKLASQRLSREFKRRAQNAAGKKVGASIVLPPDLNWVMIQEIGSPEAYPIAPSSASGIKLPAREGFSNNTFIPKVGNPYTELHPAVRPQRFIARVMPDLMQVAREELAAVLVDTGFDPASAQQKLMKEIMPAVLDGVASSLGESLGQHNMDTGKLDGREPEEVFRQDAIIIGIDDEMPTGGSEVSSAKPSSFIPQSNSHSGLTHEKLLSQISKEQSAPGNYVSVRDLRKSLGLTSENDHTEFDKAVFDLAGQGKLIVGSYDGPHDTGHDYVTDSRGKNYIGLALPRK